ncbi:hypothetical protein ABK040_001473 [Willaertia magna]
MLSNVTYRFDLPLSIKLLPMATAFTKLALGIEDNLRSIHPSHYNLQIDKLNQLEELYLNNLQILHADIDNDYCIKNLFNLTELKIETKWKDNFTGKYLPKLQNLKVLHVSYTNVTDDKLKGLKNLIELNISNCTKIQGYCLKELLNLERLTANDCFKIHVFNDIIGNLTQLKEFYCVLNFFNVGTSFVKNLTNLTKLDLVEDGFNVVETNDEDFKKLTKLKYLKTEWNLNGKCFSFLPNLEELNYYLNCSKERKYIKNLKKLKKLTCEVYLDDNEDFKDFSNLEELNLCGCEMNGNSLLNLRNLTKLDISYVKQIEDKHLMNLQNLKQLNMSNCTNINGSCFQKLLNLEMLDVSNGR